MHLLAASSMPCTSLPIAAVPHSSSIALHCQELFSNGKAGLSSQGQEFQVASFLRPASSLASPPQGAYNRLHINSFDIDYRPNGEVAQYYTDASMLDDQDRELTRQRISVNTPFRYKGVTMYQTDWSLAAVTLRVLDGGSTPDSLPSSAEAFNMPLASLDGQPGEERRL